MYCDLKFSHVARRQQQASSSSIGRSYRQRSPFARKQHINDSYGCVSVYFVPLGLRFCPPFVLLALAGSICLSSGFSPSPCPYLYASIQVMLIFHAHTLSFSLSHFSLLRFSTYVRILLFSTLCLVLLFSVDSCFFLRADTSGNINSITSSSVPMAAGTYTGREEKKKQREMKHEGRCTPCRVTC